MKHAVKRLLVALLVPVMRAIVGIDRGCRLDSFRRLARQAGWKARLAHLGEESVIYPHVVIHGPEHVAIGARCAIAEFVHMWGGITIGNDVMIASHTVITSLTHDTRATVYRESLISRPVIIEDNVWIGAGAVILPGVRIGTGSVIGAGSVVTWDVPAGTIVVGCWRVRSDQSNGMGGTMPVAAGSAPWPYSPDYPMRRLRSSGKRGMRWLDALAFLIPLFQFVRLPFGGQLLGTEIALLALAPAVWHHPLRPAFLGLFHGSLGKDPRRGDSLADELGIECGIQTDELRTRVRLGDRADLSGLCQQVLHPWWLAGSGRGAG